MKDRSERAESELKAERERWLGMFKDLYQLSKTGELAKVKEATLEETLSKQSSPCVSVPQSPNPFEEENSTPIQVNTHQENFQLWDKQTIKPSSVTK
jgi:hypothetical protein